MVHLRGKLLPALTISSHLNIGRDGEVLIEADHRVESDVSLVVSNAVIVISVFVFSCDC